MRSHICRISSMHSLDMSVSDQRDLPRACHKRLSSFGSSRSEQSSAHGGTQQAPQSAASNQLAPNRLAADGIRMFLHLACQGLFGAQRGLWTARRRAAGEDRVQLKGVHDDRGPRRGHRPGGRDPHTNLKRLLTPLLPRAPCAIILVTNCCWRY